MKNRFLFFYLKLQFKIMLNHHLRSISVKTFYYAFFWGLISSFLNSCVSPGVKVQAPSCPELTQGCYNTTWSGLPIYDTNSNVANKSPYFVIDDVGGISSPEDDWQLAFISPDKAVFTFTELGINRSMIAKKLSVNEFSIDKGIRGLPEAHSGIFSFADNLVAFTLSPNNNPFFIKKHVYDELASTVSVLGRSRIYYGKYINDEIIDRKLIPDKSIGDLDWSGHPTLSGNGRAIFYSSDRPGGLGGNDIWLSIQEKDGNYSEPINVGQILNSRCDELSPFISKDLKRLYFSSAGHSTVGGYDLFYSEINSKFWDDIRTFDSESDVSSYFSQPINLGFPLNTSSDELFPTCPGNCEDTIYYSSNQNSEIKSLASSRGGFDLFVAYKVRKIIKSNDFSESDNKKTASDFKPKETNNEFTIPTKKDVVIKGKVFDKASNFPVDSAIVSFEAKDNKHQNIEVLTDKYGKFELQVERNIQFDITAQKKEYFFDSKRLMISQDFLPDTSEINFYLPQIGVIRLNFPTDEFLNPYKYTLDTNGVETGRYWKDELKLVASNIMLALDRIDKIILVGHTDDVGTDDYNVALGQRRVDFVIDELEKLGVPKNILYGRSAGESEQISRNSGEDLSAYRKRLRRVTMEKFFK